MKAIVIEKYGDKDQLKEKEVSIPEVKDNQVLVEVKATSINPIDWKLREGFLKDKLDFDFPIILGWDAAGIVKKVGRGVTEFKEGDRVYARPATTRQGTYAEYTTVDQHLLALMPENITFEEAAAVPLAGQTAWQCLVDFGGIGEGDQVLIHAGSGGVGHYAIQIAKALGAQVAATASGENQSWVKELGTDRFINYKEEDFAEVLSGYDFVLDTLGGDIQEKSYQVLKEGGKLASIVQPPEGESAEKHGVEAEFVWLEESGRKLEKLSNLIVNGKLSSVIGHKLPLTENGLKEAHEISESHHAKGKIVIHV
ncbi:NADP-dependent oxidoreductase [Halobacillus salinarum]|uniref:NADP-dependent oxidoreductase n=1 Tax=Halobacillus salinarum TaxID=2932257 RepID=A0ABY4ELB0_9BACI|nr:NADP-dependent oxidoreductase [Halobacillus salinarum]UOQ45248.1 NADP-dependent oxidoreductase [Halobacillus salinarum]